MLREIHRTMIAMVATVAMVAMVAKASLLPTQSQCRSSYGWRQTLQVMETGGTVDSLLRLADDSMVGRKGAGRGQVDSEHLIPANGRASVRAPVRSLSTFAWYSTVLCSQESSGHGVSHLTGLWDRSLLGDTLYQVGRA